MYAKKYFKFIFAIFAFLLTSTPAYAATLFLSPPTASNNVNQTVTVRVVVSSKDQAANAVSGKIIYPSDKLQLLSISKVGSIINFWAEEPSFSNGTAQFSGVIMSPGYTGSFGQVVTLTFKSLSAGDAAITLSNASVLANDGQGTEILTGTQGSIISIREAPPRPIVEPTVPQKPTVVPKAPSAIEATTSPLKNESPVGSIQTEIEMEGNKPAVVNDFWYGFVNDNFLAILAFILLVLVIILLLGLFIVYSWFVIRGSLQELRHRMQTVDMVSDKIFTSLEDEIEDHIKLLENKRHSRSLTAEEELFLERFSQKLKESHKVIHSKTKV
ncbi:MAG: cohesin domain-containing protein [bacterium]|nr:cohesin domain-containing protein [bacterium]